MEDKPPFQTLYLLNRSDRHRIDAAIGLLRQVLEDLMEARAVRVSNEPNSPGALYELAEEAERANDERRQMEMDF